MCQPVNREATVTALQNLKMIEYALGKRRGVGLEFPGDCSPVLGSALTDVRKGGALSHVCDSRLARRTHEFLLNQRSSSSLLIQ